MEESTDFFTNPAQLKIGELVYISLSYFKNEVKNRVHFSSLLSLDGKIGIIIGFNGSNCCLLTRDGKEQIYTYLLKRVT